MQNIQALLNDHDACEPARKWAHGKTWQTIYDTCERGEWLTWLLSRIGPDLDKHTCVKLAAALANTVRHLMPDASKEALDVAIRYGNGEATDDELEVAADAAEAAAEAAEGVAWAAASEASWAVRLTVKMTAAAVRAAVVVDALTEATSEQQLANIVREIIPIEMFNIDPNSTYTHDTKTTNLTKCQTITTFHMSRHSLTKLWFNILSHSAISKMLLTRLKSTTILFLRRNMK
jgi:hypothetical protein